MPREIIRWKYLKTLIAKSHSTRMNMCRTGNEWHLWHLYMSLLCFASRKLERTPKSKTQVDSQLKYRTGEWFYEAKSRRHMDKIHGSEIILASMKQRKAGLGEFFCWQRAGFKANVRALFATSVGFHIFTCSSLDVFSVLNDQVFPCSSAWKQTQVEQTYCNVSF